MSSVGFRFNFLTLAVAFGTVPLFSQNGTIQGTVVDPATAVISNCRIEAADDAKDVVVRQTITGSDGAFQLQPLPPGTYSVRVECPGMKKAQRTGVVLDVNQILNLGSIRMEIGATSESVTVSAETPQVETTTADKNFVITSTQVTRDQLEWPRLAIALAHASGCCLQ